MRLAKINEGVSIAHNQKLEYVKPTDTLIRNKSTFWANLTHTVDS